MPHFAQIVGPVPFQLIPPREPTYRYNPYITKYEEDDIGTSESSWSNTGGPNVFGFIVTGSKSNVDYMFLLQFNSFLFLDKSLKSSPLEQRGTDT